MNSGEITDGYDVAGIIAERSEQVRSRLEGMANRLPANEQTQRLLERTEECQVDTTIVKHRAIRQIAKLDKQETGVMMANLDGLSVEMDRLATITDIKELNALKDRDWGRLTEASELIEKYQNQQGAEPIMSPLDRFNRAVRTNQVKRVKTVASEIGVLCRDPNIPWTELVRQGIITQDFMDNIDIVGNYLEMAAKWHVIEAELDHLDGETIRAIRAQLFLPYLDKDIAPEMIDQIVEGKFDMGEEFVDGALSMFAQMAEELKSPSKRLSKKQKLAMGVVMASLVLTVASANYQLPIPTRNEAVAAYNEHLQREDEYNKVSGKQQENKQHNSSSSRHSHSKIENSGGGGEDEYAARAKNAIWELQGRNLDGYYRTNTASELVIYWGEGLSWNIPFQDSVAYYPAIAKRKPDETATQKFDYLPDNIDLPTKYGQDVDPDSVVIMVDGQPLLNQQQYYTYLDKSGNYFVHIESSDNKTETQQVAVTYGLRNVNAQLEHRSDPLDTKSIVDLSNEKVFSMFKQVIQKYGNNKTKLAYAFRDWIRRDFTYSLDPKQSDYYQSADTVEGFFERAIGRKKVDCDVANTILIGHLRAAGIESRMAFGFYNAKGKNASQLTENEAHGWVEAYLDGKWTILDATPTKMDRFTEKEMQTAGTAPQNGDKGNSDGAPSEESGELGDEQEEQIGGGGDLPAGDSKLSGSLKDLMAALESVKEWTQENPELPTTLLVGLYKALLIKSYLRMRKALKRADQAHDRIVQRINEELRDAEGKLLVPENSMEAARNFFYRLMEDKASLPAGVGIGGFFKKTITWFTLPITGTYA